MRIGTIALAIFMFVSGACGGGGRSGDAGEADTGGAPDGASDAARDTGTDAGPVDSASDTGSASLTVRIAASGDVFVHADGLGGQTARATVAGVRSLTLLRSMSDPDPLVLYRAVGPDMPVGYVPGDETVLTTLDASSLAAGTYTFGRIVQTYARYEVDATLHRLDGTYPGVVSAFQVITDGTEVDGSLYDGGHYELTFAASGVTAEWSGEDGVFPMYTASAGAFGVVEDGEWAIYFPISLEIAEVPTVDTMLTLDVNMHEGFRWTDLLLLGYDLNVFDATDISFEPVVTFGGNSFELTVTP